MQGIFQRKRDLFFHLLGRGAGIVGNDNRRFNSKRGIFEATNVQQRKNTADAQQQNRQPDANGVIDKLARDIHYRPRSRVQIRTGCWA
ncbi:hypothetical protein D3C72_813560 [compost metagenome]